MEKKKKLWGFELTRFGVECPIHIVFSKTSASIRQKRTAVIYLSYYRYCDGCVANARKRENKSSSYHDFRCGKPKRMVVTDVLVFCADKLRTIFLSGIEELLFWNSKQIYTDKMFH